MHLWSCDITKHMEFIRLAISQPNCKIETFGLDHKILYSIAQNILVFLGSLLVTKINYLIEKCQYL